MKSALFMRRSAARAGALLLVLAVGFLPLTVSAAGGDGPATYPDDDATAPADTTYGDILRLAPVEVRAAPFLIAGESATFSVSTANRSVDRLNLDPALTLDRLTTTIPGLSVNSREHYALGDRLTIRGMGWRAQFGVRGVQVLLDGIPLTVADGQSMIEIVDPAFVRSAEVIRGPASTFWGNSSGGVLALSTQPEGGPEPAVRLRQLGGSFGLLKSEVQVTPTLGDTRTSVYASYLTQDGFREHSNAELARAGVTSDIPLGDGRGLRVVGALAVMPRADSPGSLDAEAAVEDPRQTRDFLVAQGTGKSSTQGQLGITYSDALDVGTLRASLYGTGRGLENPIPSGYIDLTRRAGGARVMLENNTRTLHWGAGVEAKLQRDDRLEFANDGGSPGALNTDQRERVTNEAVFGRLALPLGRLQLSAGLRFDQLRFDVSDNVGDESGARTFRDLSPSVGAAYRFNAVRAYANLTTGLEAPTTVELGNRPDGRTGFNPNVGAERSVGLEAGVQGFVPGLNLAYDAAVFTTGIDNMLMPYQQEADGPTLFRNEGATRHTGVETALQWQLHRTVTLSGSYTHINATFDEGQLADGTSLDDNEVPGIPRHFFGTRLDWQPQGVWVSLEAEGQSSFYVNSANTASNDGAVRFHTRVGYPGLSFASVSVQPFVAVYNVFDVRHNDVIVNAFGNRFFEPGAGRHWQFGLSFNVR
ncbi:MAG: TonB-dependent receptor [Bacteroidetes bacterium]|jgi:iron complex outermembrane receptor protein|nr:TonB-dependent receptor [Bacteroidota bacterium]